MATVLNKRKGEATVDAVYVGRPSVWGNPFVVGQHGIAGECAAKFRSHLWNDAALLARLPELFDRDLICWCKPNACHADHLLHACEWAMRDTPGWLARIEALDPAQVAVATKALRRFWTEKAERLYAEGECTRDEMYEASARPCCDCGTPTPEPAPDWVDGTGQWRCGNCATS